MAVPLPVDAAPDDGGAMAFDYAVDTFVAVGDAAVSQIDSRVGNGLHIDPDRFEVLPRFDESRSNIGFSDDGRYTRPWSDLTIEAGHHLSAFTEPMVDSDALQANALAYAGGLSLNDPRVSPVFSDLRGLPPVLIQVGGAERLKADAIVLANRLIAAGVDVRYSEWVNMPHVWQIFGDFVEEGYHALQEAAKHVRLHHKLL
jgi:hypothetical protein